MQSLLFVLAQSLPAPSDAFGTFLTYIAPLGPSGILVWYIYHTNTKTIPEMQAGHANTIKAINDRNNETVKDVCTQFTESLAAERQMWQALFDRGSKA